MPEWEAKMRQEHAEKYAALAARLGVVRLCRMIPATQERVLAALGAGDEHLNTIPLHKWDEAAGMPSQVARPRCPTCGQRTPYVSPATDWPGGHLRETARFEPWCRAPGLSLAERVCVLKWVATHDFIGRGA